MRARIGDQQRSLVLRMMCGLTYGLFGVGFHLAIRALFEAIWDCTRSRLVNEFFPIMLLAPTLGGLIVGVAVAAKVFVHRHQLLHP